MAKLERDGDARVGFAELFFDLVFVFAITQVSHHLLKHFTWMGAAETALIFLTVWWVWIYSTWALNWLNPEAAPVRLLLFALMFGGLFLSMAVPEAFGERGWVFAGAYVAMQIGRTLFLYLTFGTNEVRKRTYRRILSWMVLSAPVWLYGAALEGEARFWVWLLALGLDVLAPAVSYWMPGLGREETGNWRVTGGHMAERCGLFVIICLGESLLISGATFAEMEWDGPGLTAFLANVLVSVGMWWVYFHIGHKRGAHHIEHSDDPGRIARLSFTYAHIPIVAGVVLGAVGAERAIAHPDHAGEWGDVLTLFLGIALFLAGNGWFKRLSAEWFPLSHLVGIGLCALAAAAALYVTLSLASMFAAVVLVVVAIWEDRSIGRQVAV
jgi:low temperature requirement protein LtrA